VLGAGEPPPVVSVPVEVPPLVEVAELEDEEEAFGEVAVLVAGDPD